MTIKEYMREHLLFLDGGMGALLQKRGLKPGEAPERMNVIHPEVVTQIHREYYEAGANVATSNTFGVNSLHFSHEEMAELVKAAVENARRAASEAAADQPKYVALDVGPTGRLLHPFGDLDFEDAVNLFKEVMALGAENEVDCVIIETMNDCYETKAALLAAKETVSCPVFVSNAYSDNNRLLTGADPAAMVTLAEALGAAAVGANCSLGPKQLAPVVDSLLENASIPVLFQPNAGMPKSVNGETVYDVLPQEFAEEVCRQIDRGVRIAGGCCGTTPEHIAALTAMARDKQPVPVSKKALCRVSSGTHTVELGKAPVLIGERINPTGKKRLKQALRDHDLDYILQEGIRQQDKGAQILDVNAGLPEIDEVAMLTEIVRELQAVCDTPLQLDTASPEAMEAALRRCNGVPLLNSVNGKAESMKAIFPLMQKYGGVTIALTLDEAGIPDTAQERVAIAEKIIRTAAEYGIEKERLVFDPLTMSVSTNPQSAMITLEAVRRITCELGCRTSLGVSNISFGLPERDLLNSSFFTSAMEYGLSAAIMNPDSERMMQTWRAWLALHAMDERFEGYIGFAGAIQKTPAAEAAAAADPRDALKKAILSGRKEQAGKLSAQLLQDTKPMTIVQELIIPALDEAGKAFEAKTFYLPQLLMSAEAAQEAFEPIRRLMSGKPSEEKGTVILATVKGDIHDIGKNIVKLLLENYGFRVIDLGKDVPPETILKTAQERQVTVVGLSALMTTTVPAMEETIRLLHEHLPDCRVVVGGAVLNEEYAQMIHADAYSATAMETVRYAEEILG